ncbi:hypothetical protein SNEBB_000108 [Seison nebaliae]|nr:hypothetical protein SNEBB_000108 [Seison nebaliae]
MRRHDVRTRQAANAARDAQAAQDVISNVLDSLVNDVANADDASSEGSSPASSVGEASESMSPPPRSPSTQPTVRESLVDWDVPVFRESPSRSPSRELDDPIDNLPVMQALDGSVEFKNRGPSRYEIRAERRKLNPPPRMSYITVATNSLKYLNWYISIITNKMCAIYSSDFKIIVKHQRGVSKFNKYESLRKYEKFSISLKFDQNPQKSKAIEEDSFSIIKEFLKNADPARCVLERIKLNENKQLVIDDRHYFKLKRNVHIAAFGCSVLGACYALQDMVHDHLNDSIVKLRKETGVMRIFESDEEGQCNTESNTAGVEIHKMLDKIGEEDILFVIISDHCSSLISLSAIGIGLEDMIKLDKILKEKKVNKTQINFIWKTLSFLKGRQLIENALPAKIVGLIVSDTIDIKRTENEIVSREFSPKICKCLFIRLDIWDTLPSKIKNVIKSEVAKLEELSSNKPDDETHSMEPHELNEQMKRNGPLPIDIILTDNVQTINKTIPFIKQEMGYLPFVINTSMKFPGMLMGKSIALLTFFCCSYLEGRNSKSIAYLETEILKNEIMSKKKFIKLMRFLYDYRLNSEVFKFCLMMSGRPEYKLLPENERGIGGVNQELILYAGLEMNRLSKKYDTFDDIFNINFVSFDTKGKDGNSENAGAYLSTNLIDMMISNNNCKRLPPNDQSYNSRTRLRVKMENKVIDHLRRNDSGTLINELKQSIKFGLSPTNVMSQTFILIKSKF